LEALIEVEIILKKRKLGKERKRTIKQDVVRAVIINEKSILGKRCMIVFNDNKRL
jgi:hypothetical protein